MGGFQGQASDIEIQAREIINIKQKLNEIYAQHTGQKLQKIEEDIDRDFFMTAEQAKEYGIIDKVIEKK
jgi:ATP-dependent Clp protease protease subunit